MKLPWQQQQEQQQQQHGSIDEQDIYKQSWQSAFTLSAFFFKSRSISICQTRSIQSGEKEHTDLSGRSGCGHMVLVCAEHRRPQTTPSSFK